MVVKADGLAAGKGVVVAQTVDEACEAVDAMLLGKQFGDAGDVVVVEEFLTGEEASYFVIVDAKGNILPLQSAQDHKAAYDGDRGPNTGGMGAYSPAPVVDAQVETKVLETIIEPLVRGLDKEGCAFQGVIFAGLMIDEQTGTPKVLEFNVRFGDPECEVLMHRLRSDLLEVLVASCEGRLGEKEVEWRSDPALVVVMAASGYPGAYEKGTRIGGLEKRGRKEEDLKVFHANTKLDDETGDVLAAGGRVLAVTASGSSVKAAQEKAYEGVDAIDWPEGFCRRDIGWRAIAREEE